MTQLVADIAELRLGGKLKAIVQHSGRVFGRELYFKITTTLISVQEL